MKRNTHIRSMPSTTPPELRVAIDANNTIEALRIASRFVNLGEHADAIRKAWQAHKSPEFYRAIGQDPDALIAAGVAALRVRYAH